MKNLTKISNASVKHLAIATFFLSQSLAWAQDKKEVDVNLSVDGGKSDWYAQPWAWVVGGAIFIIIIVALLSRGKKD